MVVEGWEQAEKMDQTGVRYGGMAIVKKYRIDGWKMLDDRVER